MTAAIPFMLVMAAGSTAVSAAAATDGTRVHMAGEDMEHMDGHTTAASPTVSFVSLALVAILAVVTACQSSSRPAYATAG